MKLDTISLTEQEGQGVSFEQPIPSMRPMPSAVLWQTSKHRRKLALVVEQMLLPALLILSVTIAAVSWPAIAG